ncbi:TPA: hypothetical protein EYP66_01205 [Candidatus Poribacteria bacterium]|nr:hypothetical protein [Candidatus Poribacteria bacterium]
MKKISCICTILILAVFVVEVASERSKLTSVVFPASAQTTKVVTTIEEPYDEPWRLPRQTEGFSADDAENVELVGITPGACNAVAVDGNTAYIGAGVYLLILDITDKSAPALLGSVT